MLSLVQVLHSFLAKYLPPHFLSQPAIIGKAVCMTGSGYQYANVVDISSNLFFLLLVFPDYAVKRYLIDSKTEDI